MHKYTYKSGTAGDHEPKMGTVPLKVGGYVDCSLEAKCDARDHNNCGHTV